MNSNDNAGFFVMVNLSLLNSGALPDRIYAKIMQTQVLREFHNIQR
jgi:hypothetical protein